MSTEPESRSTLGDPMEIPHSNQRSVKKSLAATSEPNECRPGDNNLGEPPEASLVGRKLSKEETRQHQAEEEKRKLREEAEELIGALEGRDEWKVPEGIQQIYRIVLIALTAILGLYLTTQTIVFIQQLAGLPLFAKLLGLTSFALFSALLGYVIYKLIGGLIRLQQSPNLNMKALQQISERRKLQIAVQNKKEDAKRDLVKYLENYPSREKDFREFKKLRVTKDDWDAIQNARQKLVAAQSEQNANDWIEDFETTFLRKVDVIADACINRYAKQIGVACAISPVPFVDRSIMIYGSLSMIRELCLIYNLKPAFNQSAALLAKSILMTYLSGVVDQGTDATAEWIVDQTTMGAAGLGRDVLAKIGSKTTEGALLGVLVLRLGKSTGRTIRPVRF